MQLITASTPAALEFLRVVNWCDETRSFSGDLQTELRGGQHVIRARLPRDDGRIVQLLAQVQDRKMWRVNLEPSPLN